jgi:hypothetical protein
MVFNTVCCLVVENILERSKNGFIDLVNPESRWKLLSKAA